MVANTRSQKGGVEVNNLLILLHFEKSCCSALQSNRCSVWSAGVNSYKTHVAERRNRNKTMLKDVAPILKSTAKKTKRKNNLKLEVKKKKN